MTEPFRIFSGWDSRQVEAAEVFAFSVRECASVVPDAVWFVKLSESVVSGNLCCAAVPDNWKSYQGSALPNLNRFNRQGVTQFSYSRFLVPYFCGYEGKALFADGCDQLCLGDVAELAAMPMDGYAVRVVKNQREGEARPRAWTSFMLLDCSQFKLWTPKFVEVAMDGDLMRFGNLTDEQIGDLPPEWNAMCLAPSSTPPYGTPEPPFGAKIAHWSYLAQPEGNSWIDRSGSQVWIAARERWREAQ